MFSSLDVDRTDRLLLLDCTGSVTNEKNELHTTNAQPFWCPVASEPPPSLIRACGSVVYASNTPYYMYVCRVSLSFSPQNIEVPERLTAGEYHGVRARHTSWRSLKPARPNNVCGEIILLSPMLLQDVFVPSHCTCCVERIIALSKIPILTPNLT